ncbi:hypothetical protein KIW84_030844 [Lathyrus oleraceus]|uniref:Reverse transcriptase domain-containing protein n=1 Tax=Pisum sativum TaxID=3888 RepID=A0A9D4XP93_PEA|nr:hypothetical protein KIW84_030844 [Pisum sativum]
MNAKMGALAQKVESLVINPTTTIATVQPVCEIYGTPGHMTAKCKLPKGNVVATPEEQKEELVQPEKQTKKDIKDKKTMNDNQENRTYVPPPPYIPSIPYSQRLKQTKQDTQYKKFVKVIEKLHVEIPFTEAITQIQSYAKFLKDILTNKRKLDDPKPLECNAIAENKLAKKQKDLGSFSIPYVLGRHDI